MPPGPHRETCFRTLVGGLALLLLTACSGLYSRDDAGAVDAGGGGGGSAAGGGVGGGGVGGAAGVGGGTGGGAGGGSGGGASATFSFTRLAAPDAGLFTAVSGRSATDVWVGSSSPGAIWHFDGSGFTRVYDIPGGREVRGLYASPQGVVFATAPGGAFICSAGCDGIGAGFSEDAMTYDVRGVCGASAVEAYVVAYFRIDASRGNSIVRHWDGTSWTQAIYTSGLKEITSCTVLPGNGRAVFAGEQDFLTWRVDAGSGSDTTNGLGGPQRWFAVSTDHVDGGAFAVGEHRRIHRRSPNGTWNNSFNPSADAGEAFRAVVGLTATEAWAGGDPLPNQVFARWNGLGWSFVGASGAIPGDLSTRGMWAAGPDTFFVVGSDSAGGIVLRAQR